MKRHSWDIQKAIRVLKPAAAALSNAAQAIEEGFFAWEHRKNPRTRGQHVNLALSHLHEARDRASDAVSELRREI